MSTTLDYELRACLRILNKENRWPVLTVLILHANIRNRCWPSIAKIMEELDLSKPAVIEAGQWLREHRAIELVPYDKRVGEELALPPRQYVYQLTGAVEIEKQAYSYLYSAASDKGQRGLLSKVNHVEGKPRLPKVDPSDPLLIAASGSRDENGSVDPTNLSVSRSVTASGSEGRAAGKKRQADPVYDWIKGNLVTISGKVDKKIDGYIGSLTAVVVNAEKERLGLFDEKPLAFPQRQAVANALPQWVLWYQTTNPDLHLPTTVTAFATSIGGWYKVGRPGLDMRPGVKTVADPKCPVCHGAGVEMYRDEQGYNTGRQCSCVKEVIIAK